MNTLIVYFSKFGNTQKIAAAIAKTLESEGSVRVISADRLTASDLNQVKYKLIALTILFILLTACGSAEPTALLIPPTAIPNPTPTPQIVYVTATPRVVEVTATPEPTAPPLAAQTAIIVPQGNPPAIDGTISPVEWDDASIETFAEGSELLLMHADGYLYLGILVNTPGSAGIPAIAILRRRNAMRSSSRRGWVAANSRMGTPEELEYRIEMAEVHCAWR